MKRLLLSLLSLLMMALATFANDSGLGKRPSPTLPIKEAIDKAVKFARENKLPTESRFITSVRYHETGPWTKVNEGASGPYWQVTYEPDIHSDGGQLFIMVYMDGKVRHLGMR